MSNLSTRMAMLVLLGLGWNGPARATAAFSVMLTELPARDGPTRVPLIEVALRNTGDETERVRLTLSGAVDYAVVVETVGGRVVAKSSAGRRLAGRSDGSAPGGAPRLKDLVPGEELRETLDLSGLYDLMPGHYEVRAVRGRLAGPAERAVQSNVLAVAVR